MSATLCPEPVDLRSGVTLEQILARAHEAAHADGVTGCPVCGGDMTPRELDAHCDDCGARLF
jgi:hypothetical protein